MIKKQSKIILISIDTLRADHLGCYGYYRRTSPNIDDIVKDSVIFKHAFAPISYTAPSFASLFTSKYPSYHHIEFTNGRYDFPESIEPMLQQILKGSGMQTAAFVSTPILNAKRTKFDLGFDTYDDEADTRRTEKVNAFLYRRGEETAKLAMQWLEKNHKDDLFLWIHLMDVHGPYSPPDDYSEMFVNDDYWNTSPVFLNITPAYNDTYKDIVPDNFVPGIPGYQLLKKQCDKGGKVISYEKNLDYYISRYDASIKYVDDQIGRITEKLKALGIYDDTMIIIHSDHGEAFGENGLYCDHGATVTLDQIHVPLIMKLPGGQDKTVTEPVSLLDVTPSVLDYYGHSLQKYGFHGESFLSEQKNEKRIIFSQFLRQLSAIRSDYQVLYGKGWFEKEFGTIFGEGADKKHEALQGGQRVVSLKEPGPALECSEESVTLKKSMTPFLMEFIANAGKKRKVTFYEEEMSDEEKDAIKEQLAALGYAD